MGTTSNSLDGFYIPNLSDVFDWSYFWTVVKNFLSSESAFVLIVIAAFVVGLVLTSAVRGMRK